MDVKELKIIYNFVTELMQDIAEVPDGKIRQVIRSKCIDLKMEIDYETDKEAKYWEEHLKQIRGAV